MRVLGLDQSTKTGFAHAEANGVPITGVIRLAQVPNTGERFNVYRKQISNIVFGNNIGRIVFESPWVDQKRPNIPHLRIAFGLIAVIKMVAADAKIGCDEVAPSEWRRSFGVPSVAPRKISKYDDRRAWLKAHTMRQCKLLGYTPRTDDEADAIGIWWTACNDILKPLVEPSFEFEGAA